MNNQLRLQRIFKVILGFLTGIVLGFFPALLVSNIPCALGDFKSYCNGHPGSVVNAIYILWLIFTLILGVLVSRYLLKKENHHPSR
jgi:uncharacterized protein YneF (UPF0154 family)